MTERTDPQTAAEHISIAHGIATALWDAGVSGPDGLTIMAMALGIYMESQEGSHRNLEPLAEVVCSVAKQTFDAFRQGKKREPAHA